MKQYLTLILILSVCFAANAQLLWPVAGLESGEGIIYRPQQYLDDEQVFDCMFIAAPEGTPVLAPTDGVLRAIYLYDAWTLKQGTMFFREADNIDDMAEKIFTEVPDKVHYPEYLSGMIRIRMSNGNSCYISGVRGGVRFKTGMKISRGDTLGFVHKTFHKIGEPHIRVSISSQDGKACDPMVPFGIESTFIPPQQVKAPSHLTEEQAGEDLTVLFDAYENLYPSKYDIITPEEDSLFIHESYEKIAGGISYKAFYDLVKDSRSAKYLHDSHTSVLTAEDLDDANEMLTPHVFIGAAGDSLLVFSSETAQDFVGRTVTSINGIPSSHYIENARRGNAYFDADNESVRNAQNLMYRGIIYGDGYDTLKVTNLVFSDGSTYEDKWITYKKYRSIAKRYLIEDISYLRNMYGRQLAKADYKFERANDSTGVFSLWSFQLNTVQLEDIASKIKALSKYPYMIIDVRNNHGGDIEVVEQLLSYFINDAPVKLNQYFRVNSNNTYSSFKHTQNYAADSAPFEEYEAWEGMPGYYKVDSTLINVAPDSLVNYKGRVYILTGENTVSAASVFASYLVRNRRAVTVGRETASGYHWLTAMKFADVILPNSRIQIRIPLVQSVFDDAVTERTPLGRGLMPDYEVPLTVDERWYSGKDFIMEKALSLIDEGKYLSEENPFEEIDNPSKPFPYMWLAVGILALGAVILIFMKKKP